jgi:hypothetical protein
VGSRAHAARHLGARRRYAFRRWKSPIRDRALAGSPILGWVAASLLDHEHAVVDADPNAIFSENPATRSHLWIIRPGFDSK